MQLLVQQDSVAPQSDRMHRLDLFSPYHRRHDAHSSAPGNGSSNSQPRYHVFRRITGYHNALDVQNPPDYEQSSARTPHLRAYDPLPSYSCSVAHEGVLQMRVERPDPFHKYKDAMWEHVHVCLRGTLLQISTAKTHGLFTSSARRGTFTGDPGRLIRTYTLQHAEVGLASDFKKYELLPKSPMAQLLPEAALRQLQESDPDQFVMVYNHVARVRLEEVQIVLRFGSADERAEWVDRLCAAIDIAQPLEARSEPKYHTLPRRRRRDGARAAAEAESRAVDAATAASVQDANAQHEASTVEAIGASSPLTPPQQDSLLPLENVDSVAQDGEGADDGDGEGDADGDGGGDGEAGPGIQGADQGPDPDADDLDLAFMAAGQASSGHGRPSAREGHPSAGANSPTQFMADDWGDAPWKNAPSLPLDAVREARYRRRCMPMLVSNSRYASDIIFHKGKRMVIDWPSQTLQSYPVQPPPYSRVGFANAGAEEAPPTNNLKRLIRQASATDYRSLARFRSKEHYPEHANSSADGTDISRSSEDAPTSSLREGNSWSKRIKAFAHFPNSEEPVSPDTSAGIRETVVHLNPVPSESGLIPVSPTSPASRLAPEPVQRDTRPKLARILGTETPASSHPAMKRSQSANTLLRGTVSPQPESPSLLVARKANKVLGQDAPAPISTAPNVAQLQHTHSELPDTPTTPPPPQLRRAHSAASELAGSPGRARTQPRLIPLTTPELPEKRASNGPVELPGSIAMAAPRVAALQGIPSELPGSPGRSPSTSTVPTAASVSSGATGPPASPPQRALKRVQSSDAIPTRPRYNDKAFRTLGIVS